MGRFPFSSMLPLNEAERRLKEAYLEGCRLLEQNSDAVSIQSLDELWTMLSTTGATLLARVQDTGSPILYPHTLETTSYYQEIGYQRHLQQLRQQGLDDQMTLEDYACNIRVYLHGRYTPIGMHDHDFYELVCLLKGTALHFVGDNRMVLRAGDLIFIPPGVPHTPVVFSDDALLMNVAFGPQFLDRQGALLLSSTLSVAPFFRRTYHTQSRNSYLLLRTGRYPSGETLLADLYQLRLREDFHAVELRRLQLLQMLLTLDERLRRSENLELMLDEPLPESPLENQIIAYIRTHFDTVTRAELAEHFAYSERQITRVVKNETGLSFSDYQRKLRMDYIAEMLTSSETPIKQIVESAGYTQNSYFFKMFRQTFDVTPAEFREQHLSA